MPSAAWQMMMPPGRPGRRCRRRAGRLHWSRLSSPSRRLTGRWCRRSRPPRWSRRSSRCQACPGGHRRCLPPRPGTAGARRRWSGLLHSTPGETGPGTPAVEPRSCQTLSGAVRLPSSLRCSWVPPMPVTSGSDAGQSIAPVEEQQITSAGFAQSERGLQILVGRALVTARRQDGHPVLLGVDVRRAQRGDLARAGEALLVGTEALGDHVTEMVVDDVVLRRHDLREPVDAPVSVIGVSTRRMLAFGAITCDHSTSRLVSSVQP